MKSSVLLNVMTTSNYKAKADKARSGKEGAGKARVGKGKTG